MIANKTTLHKRQKDTEVLFCYPKNQFHVLMEDWNINIRPANNMCTDNKDKDKKPQLTVKQLSSS